MFCFDRHHCVSLVLTNAELVRSCEGDIAAMKFLAEHLHRRPSVRGTKRLLELNLDYFESDIRERLEVLNELAARLLADKPAYKCCHCGFTGKSLHWQCPSCKNWSSVRPIQGVEGE